ncbi:asparagine synthase-related protein [Halorussus gelatinilyticus]|uniref:Asparagine synthase-related protein n=1 Tax=Halorussus gelatinilyticus TaxID=2937524 RepID=A0A8U0IP53_9EURY|nr:asparagine synthase-related protein [Halorussus gelatinilyticus]UPW02336.1 asparagine synthase-related protein [Halorussus gelatinilyticus]
MRGASAERVARAVADGNALFDSPGFAGRLPDGRLVRDVLGRQPIFVESGSEEDVRWSFSPGDLADPEPVPAGHVFDPEGVGTAAGEGGLREAALERVFSLPDPEPIPDDRETVRNVGGALRESLASVESGAAASGDLAVAFSGGVDSAVVASAFDAPLYVVGFPESHDVAAARRAARLMGREADLRVFELSPADVERAVPEVARATGRTNAMDVQIALPLYLAAERASRDGFDRLAVGQGADELFGGYAKVARAPEDPRVEAETVRGAAREVVGTLPDQLERDVLALRAAGVEPVAPLLDDRVVRAALALPGESLVDSRGERKKAFRLAAREFVPDGVAFREKKAVQYGSLVAREVDRLARQAGFKRRMDDHVSRYVASLVEE